MEFYIDIQLKPDAEMPVNRLLNALYTKLHKALCDLESEQVGVSFPAYKVLFGDKIRIHGSMVNLTQLQSQDWVGRLVGYCKFSDILSVPSDCKFRTVKRKQATMSRSKLNRLLKRGSITALDIKTYKAKMFDQGLDNPYLEVVSGSNGHLHRRYIAFGPILEHAVQGSFDQFGLSKAATVPWF